MVLVLVSVLVLAAAAAAAVLAAVAAQARGRRRPVSWLEIRNVNLALRRINKLFGLSRARAPLH